MASVYDWEAIRAEYEAGASQSALAKKYGLSRKAIQNHIRAEGWVQDVSEIIQRITEAKVAGIVAGCDYKKKAEALDRAADAKAAVVQRHKREWDEHQAMIVEAIEHRDFELAKIAKITAETLRIRQDGERRAWGLADKPERTDATPIRITWLPPTESWLKDDAQDTQESPHVP